MGKICFAGLLKRALKNMITPRKGDWGHALRVMAILGCLGFGGGGLLFGAFDRNDLMFDYPPYEVLKTATGMLLEVRTRRTSTLLLEVDEIPSSPVIRDSQLTTNKPVIRFVSDFTLRKPLETLGWEAQGDIEPRFVSVKYFSLPSGRYWLAELCAGKEVVLNYENRKAGFAARREMRRSLDMECIVALLIGISAFAWMLFEARSQLKRESVYG